MHSLLKNRRVIKIHRENMTNTEEMHNSNDSENTNIIPEINTFQEYKNVEEYNSFKLFINYSKKLISYCLYFVQFIIKISGVYILWIILHFVSSHLYIKFCVPSSFMGFIISPFMTSSPHCQGLRWIIYNGANTINNMWIILGTWLCSYLIQLGNKNNDE
jgi:hypothetical protein